MAKIKFIFYTTNPENAVVVETGVTLNGNIASVPISADLFQNLEDGVLNYIVEGDLDDDTFVFERQSNYFLKTPVNYSTKTFNLEEQSHVYTENGEYTITPNEGFDGLSKVYINVNVECEDCPELTSIDITENGTYEGAYNVVNVNIPQEGGDCNLGQLNIEWESNWKRNYFSATRDGYDGYDIVEINAENALNEKFNQGRDSIINTLTTLDVTENGTYTHPTVPILIFDGDDMFDFAYADTVNAIEFKIKVNGKGWVFGDNTAGIYARSTNTLEIYWFGYETITTEFNEDGYNTFLLKPYDTENRLVINGIDRSGELTEREWSTDGTDFYLGGNGHFNFVYAKFWSEYSQYNKEEKPLFYTIPNTDGNAKTSTYSGEFEVLTNIGGGTCQYTEEKFNFGYSSVNVNVNVTSKLSDLKETIDTDIFERYASNDGYDGYSHVYLDATPYGDTKYSEGRTTGRNEITNLPEYRYILSPIQSEMYQCFDSWAILLEENNVSTMTGIMFDATTAQGADNDYTSPIFLLCGMPMNWGTYREYDRYIVGDLMKGTTIEYPWVYNENYSFSKAQFNPDYWIGGFNCSNVAYIEGVFDNVPSSLTYFGHLYELGQSLRSVCTLDFSPSALNSKSLEDIGNSVYDFTANKGNAYGITTANVKFNGAANDDIKNIWSSKGWTIVE